MNLFTKPCGCRGTGFLCSDYNSLTVRKMWVDDEDSDKPLSPGNIARCGTYKSGSFPGYTSTDTIEIQEEKEKTEHENWTQTVNKQYLVYGCLKCGESWRELYKSRTSRNWKKGDC